MATARMPQPQVDPVKADSKHYTVEFENDKVRVVVNLFSVAILA